MTDFSRCYRKNSQIITKQLGEESYLIDPYRRALIKLNPVALDIWQLIDGTRSGSEILEVLKMEFEVKEDILKSDLGSFLRELVKREIIS